MAIKTKIPRVVRPEPVVQPPIELLIPYGDKTIVFVEPSQGPHNYQTVGRGILARNLRIPTGEETASLIHAAYCSPEVHKEPEFSGIRNTMDKGVFWVYDHTLWVPKGFYVVQDPKAEGLSVRLNPEELEERLTDGTEVRGVRFSREGTVRFAPREICRLGEQNPKDLATNGVLVASYGEQGAEQLAEVAAEYRVKPFVYGVQTERDHVQRVSALLSGGFVVSGLVVNCLDRGGNSGGFAFGVK